MDDKLPTGFHAMSENYAFNQSNITKIYYKMRVDMRNPVVLPERMI